MSGGPCPGESAHRRWRSVPTLAALMHTGSLSTLGGAIGQKSGMLLSVALSDVALLNESFTCDHARHVDPYNTCDGIPTLTEDEDAVRCCVVAVSAFHNRKRKRI